MRYESKQDLICFLFFSPSSHKNCICHISYVASGAKHERLQIGCPEFTFHHPHLVSSLGTAACVSERGHLSQVINPKRIITWIWRPVLLVGTKVPWTLYGTASRTSSLFVEKIFCMWVLDQQRWRDRCSIGSWSACERKVPYRRYVHSSVPRTTRLWCIRIVLSPCFSR